MFETLGLVLMGFVLGTFVYFALNGLLEAICYAFDRFASFVAAIPRIIVASIEHIVVAPMFSIIAWIASMLRLLQDASSVALMEGLSWFVVLFILFVSISMVSSPDGMLCDIANKTPALHLGTGIVHFRKSTENTHRGCDRSNAR